MTEPSIEERERAYVITFTDEDARVHRDDGGPAVIEVDRTGVTTLRWCEHGESHRVEGPAEIVMDSRGDVVTAAWFWHGWPTPRGQVEALADGWTASAWSALVASGVDPHRPLSELTADKLAQFRDNTPD